MASRPGLSHACRCGSKCFVCDTAQICTPLTFARLRNDVGARHKVTMTVRAKRKGRRLTGIVPSAPFSRASRGRAHLQRNVIHLSSRPISSIIDSHFPLRPHLNTLREHTSSGQCPQRTARNSCESKKRKTLQQHQTKPTNHLFRLVQRVDGHRLPLFNFMGKISIIRAGAPQTP